MIYFYWRDRVSKRSRDRGGIFHLLIHLGNGCSDQSWANPHLRASSLFQVFHMGVGCQGFGPPTTVFPGHKQNQKWKKKKNRKQTSTHMGRQDHRRRLSLICHSTSPSKLFLNGFLNGSRSYSCIKTAWLLTCHEISWHKCFLQLIWPNLESIFLYYQTWIKIPAYFLAAQLLLHLCAYWCKNNILFLYHQRLVARPLTTTGWIDHCINKQAKRKTWN